MSNLIDTNIQPEPADESEVSAIQSLSGEELMTWTIKALPHPMFAMDIAMGIGALFPLSLLLYFYLGGDPGLQGVGVFGVCLWLFFWKKVVRQKNVYQYRITNQGGEVEYWMDFPEGATTFFKWLSGIFLIVVLCMIAVEPSFFWMLAGPGGMAIGGARFFLGWENKKERGWFKWDDYDHVIIDRKRKVVVFLDHPLVFEAFLERSQIDKYVETIRPHMPSNTRFVEERWKY